MRNLLSFMMVFLLGITIIQANNKDPVDEQVTTVLYENATIDHVDTYQYGIVDVNNDQVLYIISNYDEVSYVEELSKGFVRTELYSKQFWQDHLDYSFNCYIGKDTNFCYDAPIIRGPNIAILQLE